MYYGLDVILTNKYVWIYMAWMFIALQKLTYNTCDAILNRDVECVTSHIEVLNHCSILQKVVLLSPICGFIVRIYKKRFLKYKTIPVNGYDVEDMRKVIIGVDVVDFGRVFFHKPFGCEIDSQVLGAHLIPFCL
jgi:hypothetical protein